VLKIGPGTDDDDDDDEDDDDDDDNNKAGAKPLASAQPKAQDSKGPSVIVVPIGIGQKMSRLRATLAQVAAAANGTAQYYVLESNQRALAPGQHVYVRVPQPGSGAPQKVIPYAAVIYDYQGKAWTYVNSEPQTYVRHALDIEYVQGDIAVLKEGPAPGTQVVTAGAPELMGVEQKFGH
jgi:hypothetical protein